jgi:ABC-2 type transport system permease protein
MYSRVRGILIKEFLHIARDPRTLAVVLLMTVVQLCLFGYAINTVVDQHGARRWPEPWRDRSPD